MHIVLFCTFLSSRKLISFFNYIPDRERVDQKNSAWLETPGEQFTRSAISNRNSKYVFKCSPQVKDAHFLAHSGSDLNHPFLHYSVLLQNLCKFGHMLSCWRKLYCQWFYVYFKLTVLLFTFTYTVLERLLNLLCWNYYGLEMHIDVLFSWSIILCAASIYVRVSENRMDLLRAVIIGPQGTPYHDGLFFFDAQFPASYPASPPVSILTFW